MRPSSPALRSLLRPQRWRSPPPPALSLTPPPRSSSPSTHLFSTQRTSKPPDKRADINLTTARPPIASLYSDYSASPSLSTLNPLISALHIHQHVYQLSNHLRAKLAWTSPTALLFFSDPTQHPSSSPSPSPSSSLASSPPIHAIDHPTISFVALNIASLEDELLSERIVKTFQLHIPHHSPPSPPSSSPSSTSSPFSPSQPIIVESDWRTERNKLRGLGIFSYSIRTLVHIPLPLTTDFPSAVSSTASHLLSPSYASFVLVDGHDTDRVGGEGGVEGEAGGLLEGVQVLMGMGGLSREEFVWLLSVLCTFPSDVAFDVLSDRLLRLQPHHHI